MTRQRMANTVLVRETQQRSYTDGSISVVFICRHVGSVLPTFFTELREVLRYSSKADGRRVRFASLYCRCVEGASDHLRLWMGHSDSS